MLKAAIFDLFYKDFVLLLWQQWLPLGYHDVAILKIYYLNIKKHYHINKVGWNLAGIHDVDFFTFSHDFLCDFTLKKTQKIHFSKKILSHFFQNLIRTFSGLGSKAMISKLKFMVNSPDIDIFGYKPSIALKPFFGTLSTEVKIWGTCHFLGTTMLIFRKFIKNASIFIYKSSSYDA